MVVQLALIGYVLKFISPRPRPRGRCCSRWRWSRSQGPKCSDASSAASPGRRPTLGTGTLLFVGLSATVFAVAGVIGPEPWYAPRYVLPILGMVLGNALTRSRSCSIR